MRNRVLAILLLLVFGGAYFRCLATIAGIFTCKPATSLCKEKFPFCQYSPSVFQAKAKPDILLVGDWV